MSQSTAPQPQGKPASNLAMRVLTALVALPLLLALIFLGPKAGWLAFMALATAISAYELFSMTHPADRQSQAVGVALTVLVFVGVVHYSANASVILCGALLLPFAGQALTLARLGDMKTAALRSFASTTGPLYVGGGLGALSLIRDRWPDGGGLVLLALMLSWMSDTGGYFFGRFFGKHKLYEAVSPKKTLEGAVGGLLFSIGGALLGSITYLQTLPPAHAIALGLIGGALGQLGDLGESLLKRSVGVKDSGGIVPGHGGLLDRVDALLITGPVVLIYASWVR